MKAPLADVIANITLMGSSVRAVLSTMPAINVKNVIQAMQEVDVIDVLQGIMEPSQAV